MVIIKTIPHQEQRYNTVGDYQQYLNKDVLFTISDVKNEDYHFLVALHELIEHHLVSKRGITMQSIDDFDVQFEQNRKAGDESEPGDDVNAPYYKEHQFAMNIERQMAEELGVNWDEYEETLNKVYLAPKCDNPTTADFN